MRSLHAALVLAAVLTGFMLASSACSTAWDHWNNPYPWDVRGCDPQCPA